MEKLIGVLVSTIFGEVKQNHGFINFTGENIDFVFKLGFYDFNPVLARDMSPIVAHHEHLIGTDGVQHSEDYCKYLTFLIVYVCVFFF